MASGKKRRKAARQARKGQARPGPFRHPDGDRRHRGASSAKEALARKQAMHQPPALPASEEEE
jgi:hypothetical protein